MKTDNKKKETYYFDRTISQNNNLEITLGRIANSEFSGFEDGDTIYFFLLKSDKKVSTLYFANYDHFNMDEYIFVDKIMLSDLKDKVIFNDFHSSMKAKLQEIRNANCS